MRTFILGARDPEMAEIWGILARRRIPFRHLVIDGKSVRPHEAYSTQSRLSQPFFTPFDEYIFIECNAEHLIPSGSRIRLIDHHNPGDPGYDMPPEQFLKGSSLGQLCELLQIEPTHNQKLIAAADHCLSAAYAGKCPGIDPNEVLEFRLKNRASFHGCPLQELKEKFFATCAEMKARATDNRVSGEFFMGNEVSAYLGLTLETSFGNKKNIFSPDPEIIREWMTRHPNSYGNPIRGYAGVNE